MLQAFLTLAQADASYGEDQKRHKAITPQLVRPCCFFDEYHKPRLPFPCGIRAIRRRSKWFFSLRLDPVVPECPAMRSALLRPETTVAETVEFLRLSGPGQGPREPS